jgi:hypothetical protein
MVVCAAFLSTEVSCSNLPFFDVHTFGMRRVAESVTLEC